MRKNITQLWGLAFSKRHAKLFEIAKENKLALCGSTAYALVKGREDYTPKDLDFVGANNGDVENAIADICMFMSSYPAHWRIYCNSNNGYCAGLSKMHVRITSPFWLPVCIFGIPAESFKRHQWKGNVYIQDINTIKAQAKEFSKVDDKARLAAEQSAINSINEPTSEPFSFTPPAKDDFWKTIFGDKQAKPSWADAWLKNPGFLEAKETPPYTPSIKEEG